MARPRKQRRDDLKTGRVTHRFELKITEPIENELDRAIQTLKDDSKFASTMREALMLKLSLAEGRVDVLWQQFPHVVSRLASGDVIIQAPTPQPQQPPDNSKELDRLKEMVEQQQKMIKDLNDLVVSMVKSGGYVMQQTAPQPAKRFDQVEIEKPVFEDDDLPLLTTTRNTSNTSMQNFVKGLIGLDERNTAPVLSAKGRANLGLDLEDTQEFVPVKQRRRKGGAIASTAPRGVA